MAAALNRIDEGLPQALRPTANASDGIGTPQVSDLQTLQRQLSDLRREADAVTQTGDRTVWIGYTATFIAIPFVVVLFRLHMQAWHYGVAGALFLVGALVTHAMELAAMSRHDQIMNAMQRAQEAYEAARRNAGP